VTQRSDKALAKRILAGDREACVELIRQLHAPIYRMLFHLCRDAHLAEDLTQESFMTAWTKLGGFQASSSLNTWLHKIAYRKFIDAHRRQQRTVVAREASADTVRSNAANPYESALAQDENQKLYVALDRLEPAERDVVVLHYLQGMSYEEMADVLAQPSGTVKWRTREALENLRTILVPKSDQ
jgi:RNA polymerase sigma-70 factor (ECF subfamily)